MLKTTELVLEGIEFKKAAIKDGRQQDLEMIESKLNQLIEAMGMNELIDLATTLTEKGEIDFGYPQKIVTDVKPPSPTRSFFGLSWLIFKGKK